MRGLGIGIGKILKPLGGLTEDIGWMDPNYPRVLKKLAKHPDFAEKGKYAILMADAYICGFMRGQGVGKPFIETKADIAMARKVGRKYDKEMARKARLAKPIRKKARPR
jgi:hypothetical protein